MSLLNFFVDSLYLLKRQPKLFLPKLEVAFLYGLQMVLMANFFLTVYPSVESKNFSDPLSLLFYSVFLLVFVFFVFFADILVNAMYPAMINDFFKKKRISFVNAIKSIRGKILKIFLSIVLLFFILGILIAVPFGLFLSAALLSKNFFLLTILLALFLLACFALTVVLYFIYPLFVLRSVFFFRTFLESWKLSRKKISKIAIVSIIPFSISIINIILAFFMWGNFTLLFFFLLLRFLIALVQTYDMVLNPSIFLKYSEL